MDSSVSGIGLSVGLSQLPENIAGNRQDTYALEHIYCINWQKLLAVVWAMKHFRSYLYKEWNQFLARWLGNLTSFELEIGYRPGISYANVKRFRPQPVSSLCGCIII